MHDDKRIKAVVLDWAGTVIDFGCLAPAAVFQEAFARFDVEVTEAEAREPMGLSKLDHIRAVLAMPRVAGAWKARHGALPDDDDATAVYEVFMPVQSETVTRYVTPVPHLHDTLSLFADKQLKVGSTTGYPREVMEKVVPLAAGIGYRPDSLVCGDDLASGRPGPMMMLQTLVNLDVWPPQQVVKIDDTAPGIHEGRAVGAWTVGVAGTGNEIALSEDAFAQLAPEERQQRIRAAAEMLRKAGADYVIGDLSGLPDVFSRIEARLAQGETPQ